MPHPETALVSALMLTGIRHRRAVAFERWLDDARPMGFSSDMLAGLFESYHKSKAQMLLDEAMSAEQLMLTYGTTDLDRINGLMR